VKSGLEEGEEVVVGRHAGLKDGQRVQVKSVDTKPVETQGH
jgi:hypothetical protein